LGGEGTLVSTVKGQKVTQTVGGRGVVFKKNVEVTYIGHRGKKEKLLAKGAGKKRGRGGKGREGGST